MREIGAAETGKLRECLIALAEHHNKVSVHFKGCYPKAPVEQTIKKFAADIDSGKSAIAVIEDGENVIGFCKTDIDGEYGVIEYLVVLEEQRGKGYGAELMDWAMSRFDASGAVTIDVKVADGNNAVTLYEKYGFRMNAHILRQTRNRPE